MIDKRAVNRGILLVSNLFSVGENYGGVCKELAVRLSHSGWNVSTTSSVKHRLLRPIDMNLTIWRKQKYYTVAQIDVFSGPAFRWAEASVWSLRRLNKPIVLILRGGNLPDFARRYPNRVKSLLNAAAAVTTPSRYLLEAMQHLHRDIHLISNPIDIAPYEFKERTHPLPKLLYLRALHQIYNPVLAVEAVKLLHGTNPSPTLRMVGPDKGDGTAQVVDTAIREAGLTDSIELAGPIPKNEVPQVMAQADIFINTTNIDNTPISVIEAMATGLCVVSTNVGGLPYLVTHEHDALLVPPNDSQAMADAIRRILTEPSLAERLSRNARATAEQFDWSVVLPQWEEFLTEVINKQ